MLLYDIICHLHLWLIGLLGKLQDVAGGLKPVWYVCPNWECHGKRHGSYWLRPVDSWSHQLPAWKVKHWGVRMTRTGEIMMKLWWKMLASKIFQLLKHGSTIGTHGIWNHLISLSIHLLEHNASFVSVHSAWSKTIQNHIWGSDLSSTAGMKPSQLQIEIKHHWIKWKLDCPTRLEISNKRVELGYNWPSGTSSKSENAPN